MNRLYSSKSNIKCYLYNLSIKDYLTNSKYHVTNSKYN